MSRFIVTEAAMRPASLARRCFYCSIPIGGFHRDDCVLIDRRARLRLTIEFEVDVPAHWDASNVEFHRNESSSCMDNTIEDVQRAIDAIPESGCMCGMAKVECLKVFGDPVLNERGGGRAPTLVAQERELH